MILWWSFVPNSSHPFLSFLTDLFFEGTISPFLYNLTTIDRLEMSDNTFLSGSIDSSIGNMGSGPPWGNPLNPTIRFM